MKYKLHIHRAQKMKVITPEWINNYKRKKNQVLPLLLDIKEGEEAAIEQMSESLELIRQ